MSGRVFPILLVLACVSQTVQAAEVFRMDITKIVEACQTESFEVTPTSGMWLSFDTRTQVTIAFNADFENPIVMKAVRYLRSRTREEFVAVRSDPIRPAVESPLVGAWFYSIYGRVTVDEQDQRPLSLKGDVHASYVSPEGNQDEGRQCLLRMKFRAVELIE